MGRNISKQYINLEVSCSKLRYNDAPMVEFEPASQLVQHTTNIHSVHTVLGIFTAVNRFEIMW